MHKLPLKIVLTFLSFVLVNLSLTAQITMTIYTQLENQSDSITMQRTVETGHLVFDNEISSDKVAGNVNLYLLDAPNGDTLQKMYMSYIDEPQLIEGKGILYVVREIGDSETEFAVARLENDEGVWVIFDDSYVVFQGDIRFEESDLK